MVSTGNMMWLLSLYNVLYSTVHSTLDICYKIYDGITQAFKDKIYVLFENIETPYALNTVNVAASSSAFPQWYYNSTTKQFAKWSVSLSFEGILYSFPRKSLPILSMEILENDAVVYDLTDFIEGITVYSPLNNDEFPSIAHILGAWSLSSGIVLDTNRVFETRVMTNEADTMVLSNATYDSLGVSLNSPEGAVVDAPAPATDAAATDATATDATATDATATDAPAPPVTAEPETTEATT